MLPDSESEAWDYIEQRFGVEKEDLEGFRMTERSGDIWIATGKEHGDPVTEGFRFLRDTKHGFKPTTYALQFMGDRMERNKVEVDTNELEILLENDMIQREMEEKGYVAISYRGLIVGCGLYKDELVSSRIPEGRAGELLNFLM